MKKEDTNLKEGKEGGTVRREEKERRNVKIIKSQKNQLVSGLTHAPLL